MDPEPKPSYEFGPFRLEGREQRVMRDGRLVALSPKVFDLLWVLVTQAGHLVEKERLLKELWPDAFVEEANLNRGISVLRKALGESESERYIETVPKRGYRFVAPVRAIPSEAPKAGRAEPARPSTARPPLAGRPAATIGAVIGILAAAVALYTALRGRSADPPRTPAAIHRQLTFTGGAITPALSPDGTRIAYVSKESPERKLMVLALDGTAARVLFTAPEIGTLRWAPDSSELTFWARGNGADGFYLAPVSATAVRRISSGPFVSAWSPDGSTIALALFVSGHIVFVNKLGELQRRIALRDTREWIWDLDWSAVHDRLLFVADDAQRRPTIWMIGADGRDQTRIYTGGSEILAARWAPAGDAAYYFTRVNQTVSLYKVRMGADSDDVVPQLLMSGLETDEGFGISTDGRRLVYARAPYYSNLWIVDAPPAGDGGQPVRRRQLTQATAVLERPRVSPDAKTVVFNMGYESRANLYTVPVEGGAPRQLTFLKAFSVGGAWSPDGRSIAFASTEGGRPRVWLVNADGSAPRPLPSGDLSESYDVTWAPGPRIVYQQAGNRNFFVLDPATWGTKPLISDAFVGWASFAVYSPNGRSIAVSWNRRPTRGIWLVDPDTSRETLVYAARRPSDPLPSPIGWSPDGRFVYAVIGTRAAYRGVSVSFEETLTAVQIVRVPVNGGRLEPVVSLPFDEVGGISMFPDGRRFVCTVYFSRSDIWIVEDFDASVSPASH